MDKNQSKQEKKSNSKWLVTVVGEKFYASAIWFALVLLMDRTMYLQRFRLSRMNKITNVDRETLSFHNQKNQYMNYRWLFKMHRMSAWLGETVPQCNWLSVGISLTE